MYSLETIRHINDEAAASARQDDVEPLRIGEEDDVDSLFVYHAVKIPHLGYACNDVVADPIELLFCDTSGWGAPDEPALTAGQFEDRVRELLDEHGPLLLAVEEAGPFQAHVQVWASP